MFYILKSFSNTFCTSFSNIKNGDTKKYKETLRRITRMIDYVSSFTLGISSTLLSCLVSCSLQLSCCLARLGVGGASS